MKKIISVICILCAVSALSAAAETPAEGVNPYKQRAHVIGVQASSVAGLGLDYKYAFGDLLHWRITGMVFPAKSGSYTHTFYNVGTDVQFNIFQNILGANTFARTYIGPSISYWVNDYSWGYTYRDIHIGATLGFELVIASRLAIHGDLGFGYYQYDSVNYQTTIAGGVGIGILF